MNKNQTILTVRVPLLGVCQPFLGKKGRVKTTLPKALFFKLTFR